MKKLVLGGMLLLACGCESLNHTEKGVLAGGALGAVGGTLIGAAAGDPGLGAAIGAGAGAVTGGLIGNAEDRAERRADARARDWAARNPPLSLADVVNLTHQHVGDELIIRQIETTRSFYSLTSQDIIFLRQQGVSERVIGYMQVRRPPLVGHVRPVPAATHVYVYDPPPSVSFGVGYGWGPRYYHRHRCW